LIIITLVKFQWWNPLNLANDIAKLGTDLGFIGQYDWEVDFYVNRKDIWR